MYIIIENLLENTNSESILFIKCDDERIDKDELIEKTLEKHREMFHTSERIYLSLDEIKELDGWDKTVKRFYDLTKEGDRITHCIQVCCDISGIKEREETSLLRAMKEFGVDKGTIITGDLREDAG
ncbi:MAG: AAA family ATPase [Thermoplasmata archaeon]